MNLGFQVRSTAPCLLAGALVLVVPVLAWGQDARPPRIRVGSKSYTENVILG